MNLDNFVEHSDLQGTDIIHFPMSEIWRKGYKLGQIITVNLIASLQKGVVLTIGCNPYLNRETVQGGVEEIKSYVSPFYHKRLVEIFVIAKELGIEPEINCYDSFQQIDNSYISAPSNLIIKRPEHIEEQYFAQFRDGAVTKIKNSLSAKKVINFNSCYNLCGFEFVLTSQAAWGRVNQSDLANIPVLFSTKFESWDSSIKKIQSLEEQIKIQINETIKNKNNIAALFESISQKLQRATISDSILWKKKAYFCQLILIEYKNAQSIKEKLSDYNNKWLQLKDNINNFCIWGGRDIECRGLLNHISTINTLQPPDSIQIPDNIPSFGNRDREIKDNYAELESCRNDYELLKREYQSFKLNEETGLNDVDIFFHKSKPFYEYSLENKITIYENLTKSFTDIIKTTKELIIKLNLLLKKSVESNRCIEQINISDVEDNLKKVGSWINCLSNSIDPEIPWCKWLSNIKNQYNCLYKLIFEPEEQRGEQIAQSIEHHSKQMIAWIQLLDSTISSPNNSALFNFIIQ